MILSKFLGVTDKSITYFALMPFIAIKHHCGLENVAKNNIIHRSSFTRDHSLHNIQGACAKTEGPHQSYSNYHNIFLMDTVEDLEFGRPWDRYYNDSPGTQSFTLLKRDLCQDINLGYYTYK